MRVATLFTVVSALLVALAGCSLGGGKEPCDLFASDVDLAVSATTKAPDPDDHGALHYGSYSVISTKKFDVHVPGWDRHTEHTVAGRLYVTPGNRGLLGAERADFAKRRGVRITPLPKLGSRAFVVTGTKPEPEANQLFGGDSADPARALPLPATAYWSNAHGDVYWVSATAGGATLQQSQRATERLAELVGRRPVELAH